jgi:hypothetical protein
LNKADDASKKILGFKYQEMVALVKCLEAKDDTSIFLECYGDISDNKISVEVKHSIDPNKKLINTHIDFWKTIYNCVENYETYKFYSKFILHTTADIKEDSIFDGWNEKESKTKLTNVLSIEATDTISKYVTCINKFDKKDLEKILDKFVINSSEKNAKDYYIDILCNHPSVIKTLKEDDRKPFINSLLGYISSMLIEADNFKWKINISDFDENFRTYLKSYQIEDLIFPNYNKEVNDINQHKFKFIQELKDIEYDTKIGRAFKNYIKASNSQLMMITKRKSLSEALDNFDEDIKELIEENANIHTDELKSEQNYDLNAKSRRFIDCTEGKVSTKKEILGVQAVRDYYPKGRLYHSIEDNESLSCKLKDVR